MKMFALLSDQGTATKETALCADCYTEEDMRDYAREMGGQADDISDPNTFADCGDPLDGGNDALSCCICGWPDIDETNQKMPRCSWSSRWLQGKGGFAMNEITLTRLGDFWEAFDADAELLAKVCRLALSTVASGRKLAGFPIQRLEEYRSRLADANVHVLLKEGRNE